MALLLAVIGSRVAGLLASSLLLAVIRRRVGPARYATVTTVTELAGIW
jgi:hypothetical protein